MDTKHIQTNLMHHFPIITFVYLSQGKHTFSWKLNPIKTALVISCGLYEPGSYFQDIFTAYVWFYNKGIKTEH